MYVLTAVVDMEHTKPPLPHVAVRTLHHYVCVKLLSQLGASPVNFFVLDVGHMLRMRIQPREPRFHTCAYAYKHNEDVLSIKQGVFI